jgi:hypothetical protein
MRPPLRDASIGGEKSSNNIDPGQVSKTQHWMGAVHSTWRATTPKAWHFGVSPSQPSTSLPLRSLSIIRQHHHRSQAHKICLCTCITTSFHPYHCVTPCFACLHSQTPRVIPTHVPLVLPPLCCCCRPMIGWPGPVPRSWTTRPAARVMKGGKGKRVSGGQGKRRALHEEEVGGWWRGGVR